MTASTCLVMVPMTIAVLQRSYSVIVGRSIADETRRVKLFSHQSYKTQLEDKRGQLGPSSKTQNNTQFGANKVLSEKGNSFVIDTTAMTIDVMRLKAQRHVRPARTPYFAPDNLATK